MSLMQKVRRLLGIVEGHEEELAETVSNRTSVSKEQAQKGLEQVQELVETPGGGTAGDGSAGTSTAGDSAAGNSN